MQIIINKEYFNITIETKGDYGYPYQIKNIIKTALAIDGFSNDTILDIFNEREILISKSEQ